MSVAISPTLQAQVEQQKALGLPLLPEVSRRRYIDPDFFKLEMDAVFRKSWLAIAHVSEVPAVGSYVTFDLPFAPVLIVRGKDMKVRAFMNACRHRGAPVVREEKGCARVLVCQYHAWSYDLDGRLRGVPQKHDFCGLKNEDYPLQSIRCESWGGLLFINFDADAMPLAQWLAPFGDTYNHIVGAPLRLVSRRSYVIDCNWKIAVEAFWETYHVTTIHKDTAALVIDSNSTAFVLHPHGHGTMIPPYRQDVLTSSEWKGTALRSTLEPIEGFDFNDGVVTPGLFPNGFVSFERAGFPLVVKWPLGPGKTQIDLIWYGRDWGDGEMPDEWHGRVEAFHNLMLEDIENMAPMQKSIEADPDKGVPFCNQEARLYQLHAQIDNLIGREHIAPGLQVPDVLKDYLIG
jgi:phenylpropionate dioxygenase-like ring-hydroxylating dioxygenase large terminal subunit